MDKLVVINSCMREDSRTKVILEAALEELASRYEIEIIDVNAMALPPVTPEILKDVNFDSFCTINAPAPKFSA